MSLPTSQPRGFSNTDVRAQNHFSNAQNAYDFRAGALHPRSDSFNTPGSDYPASAVSESRSPMFGDFNFPFNGSPHSTTAGVADSKVEVAAGDGYYLHRTVSDAASVTGSVNFGGKHRTSVGSAGHRNGSAAGSEPWTPSPSRAQANSTAEMAPTDDGNKLARKDTNGQGTAGEEEEGGKVPPWSELKTKAGKERKRLPLACIACRRKKIRCSGEKPACKHCLRSKIPCVYKVTTRKAAPRTDYMAMLDKRLKRMEERVLKFIPSEDLPDVSATGRASVRPSIPGSTPKQTKSEIVRKRSADEAFATELEQWTQSAGPKKLSESSSQLKLQKDAEARLLTEGAEHLPPMYLQEHLAEVFFECIYGQSYLLLHKPSFMRKLKAGTIPPVLTLAVCAIAARFSTHPAVGGEPAFLRGDSWATPARAIVEKRHYEPNITILTVMLILGLHTYGTCQGGLSWSFSGQAMRMAYALQLHRELDHDPLGRRKDKASELSSTDREIRRRTMWACFLMDRFSASGTERPSFGNEEYLHIQLPIKESHFQMEIPGPTEDLSGEVPNPITPGNGQVSDARDNMGIAAYVIRAVVLWGRIVKYLNLGGKEKDPHPIWDPKSGFADLRRKLDTLQESIPGFLVYNPENLANQAAEHVANQFIYLHIIMAQNLLFLNRFAIPVSPGARPPKDMPKQFLSDAGREVVDAANRISTLIENAAGHMLTVPFAGYCAYAASTVQVWGIFSKNPQLEASSKENLRHNYKYLNKMKKYWGMFHYLAESVKDIYRHFADASIKGIVTADNSNAGTPMFQYGDWFDKYPVGVSRTEFEDLDRGVKEEPGADAPMSQQSDLQSVEEFFASLSPPSKADQPRKIPRRHGKSVGDARKLSDLRTDLHDSSQLAQRQQSLASLVEMSSSNLPYNAQQMIYPQDPFEAQANFDLSAGNFYPTNPLPQLDRQMVFGAAYAGMDPSQNANAGFGLGDSFNMWDGMEMNAFGINGNGWLGQSSTAWMMPFNMEPPQIADIDAGLSTGDFSMGNTFSGPSGPAQNRSLHDLGLDGDQSRSG
jgi:hypothetical protein